MKNKLLLITATALIISFSHSETKGLPVQGVPVPEFSFLDDMVLAWMDEIESNAAVVGIMHNDKVVYLRGFGYIDQDRSIPMPETAKVRIASVVKPITAAAIHEMVNDPDIDLEWDSYAFNFGTTHGGILHLNPYPRLADHRLALVQISHLLQHRAGWDRDAPHTPEDWPEWDNSDNPNENRWALYCQNPNAYSGDDAIPSNATLPDYTTRNCVIAQEMGTVNEDDEPRLPNREEILRWILGKQLICSPGERYAYSNEGYLALGLIIDELAPEGYMEFLRTRILTPNIGIPETEFAEVRTKRSDAIGDTPSGSPFREPYYLSNFSADDVFDLCDSTVSNEAYGRLHLEARLTHGGVKASATALLHFANTFRVGDSGNLAMGRRLTNHPLSPSESRSHGGSQGGVNTYLVQRGDGVRMFIFFNRRDSDWSARSFYQGSNKEFNYQSHLGKNIDNLDQYFDSLQPSDWPTKDVEGFWTRSGKPVAQKRYFGGYDQPFLDLQSALSFARTGTRIRILPGVVDWTGTISTPVSIEAPEGPVTIGN